MTFDDFLPAVLADPNDDAPRLVLADWLEERDEPRGEFIRVQVGLARREAAHLPPGDPCTCTRTDEDFRRYRQGTCCAACRRRNGPIEALRRRERELLAGNYRRWAAGMPGPLGVSGETFTWWYRRGFVEAVTCTAADWEANADALLASCPLREVTLTTMPVFGGDWIDVRSPAGPRRVVHARSTGRGITFTLPEDSLLYGPGQRIARRLEQAILDRLTPEP